jgi:hypothetical protein
MEIIVDKRDEYFRRMQFEHELINRRLMFVDVGDSLFATYGLGLDRSVAIYHSFLKTVACVGLLVSVAVFVGVIASLLAKFYIWLDFKKLSGNEKEQFWVRTRTVA